MSQYLLQPVAVTIAVRHRVSSLQGTRLSSHHQADPGP